tara:strand:+ start:488 stop:1651 length:1164 start_codon:yes stop_codon:yes gene_type:complete
MKSVIYLDNQSTTKTDPEVVKDMLPYFDEHYGNSESNYHLIGRKARDAVIDSRSTIAKSIKAKSKEIIFTSGSTESINLAIRGAIAKSTLKKKHIITQVTEHKSVLDTLKSLNINQLDITYLPVDRHGSIDPKQVEKEIIPETVLVIVMHANNEIGTIQPIEEIGTICKEKKVFFLVDASQSYGKLPIDINILNIDLLAATAHKIYGPKGIGFLFIRSKHPKVEIDAIITGGGHERGLRSGTLAVPLIVGFAKAISLALVNMKSESQRLKLLQEKIIFKVKKAHPDSILNGSKNFRLYNNINFSFPGLDAETLISKMKLIACSTGSACSSTKLEPSHVIKALGHSDELAHSSVRFSLGKYNSEFEIDYAIKEIIKAVQNMKNKLPRL